MEDILLKSDIKTSDIRKMNERELLILSREVREFLITSVSKTGGHLASNLGVVELTIAIHNTFDLPNDKIIFDVGHQCYTHKLLTGRKDEFINLRQYGGISGFPKPFESDCDSFIVGHASTSISAALGIAKANQLKNNNLYTVAVIGDGAFTGGLAYEGLNNAGRSKTNLIVVINHNEMSISKNVGGLARYLAAIRSKSGYINLKTGVNDVLKKIPIIGKTAQKCIESSKSMIKTILYRYTFFEELGFQYIGPVDGHNIKELINAMNLAKQMQSPVVIHVETKKGKGYSFAEENPGAYHATGIFNILEGGDHSGVSGNTYSEQVGKEITSLADENKSICAITAAMKYGTGLNEFYKKHKERFFDVGIAEAHAITFAAGLSTQGMIPIFCVYSTFLQRGYDQIIHDVSIDKKHIVLAIDRAGLVGEDGETHQGIYDVAFLSHIPNVTIYSPDSYEEVKLCIRKAIVQEGIVCVRYPRGAEKKEHNFNLTTDYIYQKGTSDLLLISYGRIFSNCFKAVTMLDDDSKKPSLLKMVQISPINDDIIEIIKSYKKVIFVEEGIKTGGIASQIAAMLLENSFGGMFKILAIEGPIMQGSVDKLIKELGFDYENIKKIIMQEI